MIKNTIFRKLQELYYICPIVLRRGSNRVQCPCCGWEGKEFYPFGVKLRKNARCPNCGSLERHRLYYLYLATVVPKNRQLNVLHFAPERILTSLFRSYNNVEYLSVDIDSKKAMAKEDITGLSFEDNSFDIIFCSHVLEHIEDDRKAIRELNRVLRPDGFAILQVPIKDEFNGRKIEKTFEDFTITEPRERERLFGQSDHVRIYGRDYKDRLESAGFKVKIDRFINSFGDEDIRKFGLIPNEEPCSETEGWVYFCTK